MPYLEQASMVSGASYDLNDNWWRTFAATSESPLTLSATAIPNGNTSRMFLSIFICPSTPNPQRTQNKAETAPEQNKIGACGDYFVPEGVHTFLNSQLPATQQLAGDLRGMMEAFPNKSTLVKIPDGTSNTIMVGECAGREDVWRRDPATGALTMTAAKADKNDPSCARAQGGAWATNDNPYALGAAQLKAWCTTGGLTSAQPSPMKLNASNESGYLYFGFHDGGTNFCFGDGSVRFISEGVSLYALGALSTRGGGEMVTENY
ncbi:MAG: DUF1559 domain-containing protein [Gemmataceae bacterium]